MQTTDVVAATTTGALRMSMLCESFPSLRGKPGVRPWAQQKFAEWASQRGHTNGETWAAAFVLGVWNGQSVGKELWYRQRPYRVPQFDAVEAISVWDHAHAAAFVAWCSRPFYP